MMCITYSARPMNGGRLESALPLPGSWMWSWKVNGWWATVHTPTGTMFNRHGEELSIAKEFGPALMQIKRTGLEWLACEAFERRHEFGRGTLVILDWVVPGVPAEERWMVLRNGLRNGHQLELLPFGAPESNAVYLMPQLVDPKKTELMIDWDGLQDMNKLMGDTYYEGLVAKRADATFPIQLVDPERKSTSWIKYRFIR